MAQSSQARSAGATGDRETHELRRGSLGVFGVAFFVISAAAPLTAMAGGAPTAIAFSNGVGVPAAYVLVVLMLLVFSVGYTAMARHHTSTGAFYSYIARGLRQRAGGAAAFLALLGYNTMQIGLYGLFGVAMSGFLADPVGVDVPWWVCAFVAMAVIAVLGYRQVDLSLKVLAVLVVAEFVVVLALDVAILAKGGTMASGAALSLSPFGWDALTGLGGSAVALAVLFNSAAFVGFEATTIYSEEARDPRRTVPRATYVAVLTIGIFYVVTTWLMVNAGGLGGVQAFISSLGEDPTVMLFAIGGQYIGTGFVNVMSLLFATSVFAALLAFHNAVARYLYALGREGLLPDTLSRTHPVHLSPHAGSVSQSGLAAVVVLAFVVTGRDPVTQLFVWLTNLGTLAILVLMAMASFAVVAFFRSHPDLDRNVWRTLVAPLVAGVALVAAVVFAYISFDDLIGPQGWLTWGLPLLVPVAAAAGVAAAGVLRGRDPQRYAEMGRHREL
jgi:amino acid transporter